PFNVFTGIALGISGYLLGALVIGQVLSKGIERQIGTDQNDIEFVLGSLFGVAGFLIGLGFLNYPLARLAGAEPCVRENEEQGLSRYFTLCTDHKVVGIQFLW